LPCRRWYGDSGTGRESAGSGIGPILTFKPLDYGPEGELAGSGGMRGVTATVRGVTGGRTRKAFGETATRLIGALDDTYARTAPTNTPDRRQGA